MKAHRLLKELEQLATNLGIRVRHEQLKGRHGSPGGLCVLKGQRIVLLNSRLNENERLLALADVLAPLAAADEPLSDEAAALLESRRQVVGVRQAPTRPAGPGLKRAAPRD
jgi:hypothetical protein